MMKNILTTCVAAGALAFGAQQAHALSITLSETGFAPLTITDNGAGDNAPLTTGFMVISQTYGDYLLQGNIATTKPVIGSVSSPALSDVNTTVSAPNHTPAHPLLVTITEPGFSPGTYPLKSSINGTFASGPVTFTAKANATTIASFTGGPGSFDSGLIPAVFTSGGPLTLTMQTLITLPKRGFTSFDADIQVSAPDGGMTAILLGVGFLGVAGLRRKLS